MDLPLERLVKEPLAAVEAAFAAAAAKGTGELRESKDWGLSEYLRTRFRLDQPDSLLHMVSGPLLSRTGLRPASLLLVFHHSPLGRFHP